MKWLLKKGPHIPKRVVFRAGKHFLAYLLSFTIALPVWIVAPAAHAVFNDETVGRLPAAVNDSYDFGVGDVDGVDGPDVVVANRGQSKLLINDGNGSFTDETDTRLPVFVQSTIAVALGDVDGVNGPDIFLAGSLQNRLLINDGSGNFVDETASRLPVDTALSMDVALGDVDGDGDLDAIMANRGSRNRLWINDGSGNFSDQTDTRLAPDADLSYAVTLGDADGDGALDAFFANHGQQNRLHINNQLGSFTDDTATALPTNLAQSNDAAIVDVDADGYNDLAVADGADGLRLLINDGAGTFTPAAVGQVPAVAEYVIKVSSGDIDFDGSLDLVLGTAGQDRILLNNGSGFFSDATDTQMPADDRRSFGIALFDGDADLDLDLLAATPQGQNRLLINDIPFPRILISISPDYIEVTDTATIDVEVFDEDGVDTTFVEVIQPDSSIAAPTDQGGGVWTFVPSQIGGHTVRVTATDTLSNDGVKEAVFNAQANDITAPDVSVSVNPTSVTQGESVDIQVTASDDRRVVATSLTVGGVAVPLDADGNATFTPLVTGDLAVVAEASDAAGNTGTDSTTLEVLPDTEFPLVTLSATPDPIDITNPITINASATDNIAVFSFELTVNGPQPGGPIDEPLTLDETGQSSYTPFIPGTYTFTATAVDPAGNETQETVTVEAQGIPDAEDPVVNLVVVPNTTIPGGTVTLTVDATDNIFVVSRTLTINGLDVPLDTNNQALFTAPVLGDYTAVATAVDPSGNVGTDTVVFSAVDPATDTDPPVVDITAPDEGGDLTAQADISGTATDLTLVEYRLEVAQVGSSDFTTFATGSQPVQNDVLGTLDTSVLENGLYNIRLTAVDINGLISQVTRTYTVAGEFKASFFKTTITDLRLPVSGIEITVNRTYDSRTRSRSGDFGFGWNLEVLQEGTYTNNRVPGEGWTGLPGGLFDSIPCQGGVREDLFHITEIRFSDTEFYKFAFEVNLTGGFSSLGCEVASVGFTQVGGVPGASLDILGSFGFLFVQGGDVIDFDTFEIFNPEDVRLTTFDGRVFDLNLNDGLTRIGDTNGNSIFINSNGVVHSNGKSILFSRDAQGRITEMTDPLGNSILYGYDTNGDLETVTDRNSNVTTMTYFDGHFLDEIRDPTGNARVRNEYDADGRLIAQVDADGNRTEYDTDTEAGMLSVTDRNDVVSTFEYDDAGNLENVSTGSASRQFTYDDKGNKTSETDERGHTKTFTYNANRQPTSETDALNNTINYAYDAGGRPTQITDPGGNELNFAYDANGNVTEMRDAEGTLLQGFTYDSAGNPTQVTLEQGSVTMTYDSAGNRLTQTGPGALQLSFAYDANGRVTSETTVRTVNGTPVNEVKTYEYDANSNVTAIVDPLGNRTEFAYNGNNQITQRTDARGNTTAFVYDDRNLLIRTNHPDGTFELIGYDLEGRKTAETDRAGRTTFFEYDDRDNPTRILYPDGNEVRMQYDLTNNRTAVTDERGNVTSFAYDELNRRTSRTDALGQVTTFTYLLNNIRPATETDALGRVTTYATDDRMFGIEMPSETLFADSTTRTQTRSPSGLITSVTNELGNTTTYDYDDNNNLIRVIDAAGGVTTYTYDESNNRISETDPEGRTTDFEYDAKGNMTRRTLPLGMFETMAYDAVGNLIEKIDFNGDKTTFEYDAMNRLNRKDLPDGTTVTYTYTPTGKVATITDTRGVTTYTYDVRDRITSVAQPGPETVSYAYDEAGNRISVTAAGGTTSYTYDALNRVATVTDPDGNITAYTYDAVGNLVNTNYPNGTEVNYAYDSRNRVLQVQHAESGGGSVLDQFDYTLDAAGRRIGQTDDFSGLVNTYTYDDIDRLLTATVDGTSTTYTYDDAGNPLTVDTDGTVVTNTYDNNNRLLTSGPLTFTYDANGNTLNITDGTSSTQFQYDPENRLVRRTAPDGTITDFIYDDDGHRIRQTVDGVVTEYVVDQFDISGLAQVLAERDDLGDVLARYVYGNDLISLSQGGETSFFHTDALGTTRALTDDFGVVTDTYTYDAYGNLISALGPTLNNYLFAGEQFDPASGLYYLRARYMDPSQGRFLTADAFAPDIRDPLSLNRYLYANANPVNRIDPSGEFGLASISISIAISGILSSIAVYTFIYKPAKELYDKLDKLMNEIPKLELNKDAKVEDLGITGSTAAAAASDVDIAKIVNLGNGAVHQAYDVVYALVTPAGKWVTAIHARNSAEWLKYLPQKNMIPGKYLDCGFNSFVQKEFGLQLVAGAAVKKIPKLGTAVNVIGTYLSYFTFVVLAIETVNELGSGQIPPQPAGGSCP
ncbi:MAG: FG-GAP-like repeat-containing protein [Planctomycetota bacterium]|jgi:RHS repeat-associated protein